MSRTRPQFSGADDSDRLGRADVLLREEPDEEDEEEDEGDRKEEDDKDEDTDNGYSE